MQERAMRLQEVACAGGALELTPRATAGMAIGAPIAQSQLASVVTVDMGAKVHRGVDRTGTSVGRGHRIGWHWRRGQRMQSLLLTSRTGGLCVRPTNGFGSLPRVRRDVMDVAGFGA